MGSNSVLFGAFSSNNDAEVMASSAQFQATQQTTQVQIMGMNMLAQAQIRSGDLQFQTSTQERIAMAQMKYGDLADARLAANERRSLRNELKMATLQYNAQIQSLAYGHEEKMDQIKNDAKEMGYKQDALNKEFALKKQELAQGGSTPSWITT